MANHWFHSFLFLDLNFPSVHINKQKNKDSKNRTILTHIQMNDILVQDCQK